MFDREMTDNYYWLRERNNPEVIEYLEAENAYTDMVMKPTENLQETLYDEMLGRIKETDLSVPVKKGDYYYYTRTEEGRQYSVYCRKKGSLDAEEEVLLDVNELAEGREFMSLGIFEVSPDQNLLAYAVDILGNERYILRVKNLQTGEIYSDVIDSVSTSLEWANDNKTFFYTVTDDAWRPYKLYRHRLGDDVKNDAMVYHEEDESFTVDASKAKSGKHIFIDINSVTTSEAWFLDADNPDGEFKLVEPREQDVEYAVYHHGDDFYIVTNDNATNFKLVHTPVTKPGKENWQEIVPHRDSTMLDSIEIFSNYLVLFEREHGLKQVRVFDFRVNEYHRIEFPEPVYTVFSGDNPEYNTDLLRFTYMSLVTPRSVYDYNMKTRGRELKKQQEVLGGYDPDLYEEERVFATTNDGTGIPMSMVYKKGMKRDGGNPLYLYGYGAYGVSMDPYFSSNRLSLLDRGFIIAIAHIRGGGEMGRHWYEDGKLLNKKNTFTDFIACAEYVIEQKYTSPEKLVVSGVSAGGLLIGAVINMRPELFKAAVADVPFVDIMNTMLDPELPLTVGEYEEWGNPNEKEYFDYMMSYSPYDNVKAQEYPAMLVMAGFNDSRVSYWEPAKWVAKLRAIKTDNNVLLLRTNMTGHEGASGRYNRLEEIAFEYAFILDVLGIKT